MKSAGPVRLTDNITTLIQRIRLKSAISFDGHTALPNGASKWITGEQARVDTHMWRAKADVIVTGVGTVLADDPLLDVRYGHVGNQPILAIVDSTLRTPVTSKLFEVHNRRVLLYTTQAAMERRGAFECSNVSVVALPECDGRVNLPAMIADLARQNLHVLHVEAGSTLSGSFLRQGLVDEVLMYVAPKLLGPGLPFAQLDKLTVLDNAISLEFVSVDLVGDDLRVVARVIRKQP